MGFAEALHISKGITAIIGSGGKTSLMVALARELSASVILCTSTRIFPPEGISVLPEIGHRVDGICCVGTPAEQGKLGSPVQDFRVLAQYADYVLVEADGSKHLPLKAHDTYEPVIPEGCGRVILVVGASGLGKAVKDVVHRPHIFTALTGSDLATPEAVALGIEKENLGDIILINQADQAPQEARALGALLHKPCCVGSVKEGDIQCLY